MINEKQKLLSSINSSHIRQIAEQLISLKSDVLQQDERLVAEYIFEFYEKLGLHPVKNYCTNERFNVIVELKGMDKNGKIMSYVGHMDVVPAGSLEQWTSMPYSPQVRDGKLYGRGSCDMKGSIACSMYIAELLVQHKIRLNGGLILIYNVDEESTNIGIKKYLETPRATDLVLVGEPTNMEIALWHLGVTAFTVTLHGKSVHAAMAEPGKNAVYAGAKFIELVQGLNHTLSQNEDKHLGCGSIHVTQIEGGTKVNMIPDICILRLDRRLTAGDNKETCTAQLRRLLEQVERDTGCAWEMEVTTYCPPGICEEEIESVQIIKKNIVELYHEHPVVRNFEASCEAGLISETLNVPTVIYGPGSIEQAHNVDEYIMLEQLKKGCTLYMAFMYDYLA